MYLLLFETSGNQSFIFSTNKLRDNVGASELTAQATTTWILDALRERGLDLRSDSGQSLRKDIADPLKNPPLDSSSGPGIEVIIATSGKAALLVRDRDDARSLIRQISTRVCREAPGMTMTGVFVKTKVSCLHDAFREANLELDKARWRLPGIGHRFPRLPILVNCAVTGLPAETYDSTHPNEDEHVSLSAASRLKRAATEESKRRLNQLHPDDERFARSMNEIEAAVDNLDWLAVVHADGNGLGSVFQNFSEYAGVHDLPVDTPPYERDRFYIQRLRDFSMALEESTEAAFQTALECIPKQRKKVLMLPLVLGGDDLTAQCEGKYALSFARAFLQAFEHETARQDRRGGIIPKIAMRALDRQNLTACAGISIVKPHFPFFAAYDLAEELLTSAKQVKKRMPESPASGLDFHVLYDSSQVALSDIRRPARPDLSGLTVKPYIVTDQQKLAKDGWWKVRHFDDLAARVAKLSAKVDGHSILPRSQIHFLREGLFIGKLEADARLRLLLPRYGDAGLRCLLPDEDSDSLFCAEIMVGATPSSTLTPFLDAMDAVDFILPDEPAPNTEANVLPVAEQEVTRAN